MSNSTPPLPADLRPFAFLLDVDGTILDLAPAPREVFVSHELRDTLARLWRRTDGGAPSGRGRRRGRPDPPSPPRQWPATGGPGAAPRPSPGAAREAPRLPALDPAVKRQFAAIAEAGPGIILEDKGYSLALHY